jgi:hypothetical protein
MLYQLSYSRIVIINIKKVGREGFEPPKLARQIYSLFHLATLESPQYNIISRASGGTRTPDQLITNQLLYQLSYAGARLNQPTFQSRQMGVPQKRLQRYIFLAISESKNAFFQKKI